MQRYLKIGINLRRQMAAPTKISTMLPQIQWSLLQDMFFNVEKVTSS